MTGMDTLHSVLMAITQGLFAFLPASAEAHHIFLIDFLNLSPMPPELAGILSLGSFLALLIYFRHDWASILSSGLRILLLWKRPMMLDERMPLFLLLSTLPVALTWIYFHESIPESFHSTQWVALALVVGTLPLWFADSMNRRNKTMSFWNWKDATLLGIAQAFMLVPGMGRQALALAAAFALNYNRESAYKYVLYSFAPILAAQAFLGLSPLSFAAAEPHAGLTWMSFWVAGVVSLLVSLFTIGFIMKNPQERGVGRISSYRIALGAAVLLGVWWKSRS